MSGADSRDRARVSICTITRRAMRATRLSTVSFVDPRIRCEVELDKLWAASRSDLSLSILLLHCLQIQMAPSVRFRSYTLYQLGLLIAGCAPVPLHSRDLRPCLRPCPK